MASLIKTEVYIKGQKRVAAMVGAAQLAVSTMLGGQTISKMILKQTQQRFKASGPGAQTDPSGNPWKKLNPKTRRIRNKNTSQKLTDKGRLYKAIVIARDGLKKALKVNTGHAEIGVRHVQNRRFTKDGKVDVRYTDEYGYIHQYGGGKSNVPARAFLGVSKKNAQEVEQYMSNTMSLFLVNYHS